MFAVLRGRALSRLEIDDQLEFHGLLDWQAWMLDPAEFGGRCLRNLGPHGGPPLERGYLAEGRMR